MFFFENLNLSCEKDWWDKVSISIPIIISFFVAYLIYRQWKTEENKRKKDLFELRIEYYKKIKIYLYALRDFSVRKQADFLGANEKNFPLLFNYDQLSNFHDEILFIFKDKKIKKLISELKSNIINANPNIIYYIGVNITQNNTGDKKNWGITGNLFRSYYLKEIKNILKGREEATEQEMNKIEEWRQKTIMNLPKIFKNDLTL